LGVEGLEVGFSEGDEGVLSQAVGEGRYEFELISSSLLGRVPVTVRRYEGEGVVETVRVTAEVCRRVTGVLARVSIGRGEMIGVGDVELGEVRVTSGRGEPLKGLDEAVGRVAGAVIRAGSAVHAGELRSAVLVRRGEWVNVRCVSGGLVLKTTGRACEDGGLSQRIRVRREDSRETYWVRVTGLQEGLLVLEGDEGLSRGRSVGGVVEAGGGS
jgi:flagella basal body P-ring formation protein FlgA